MVVIKRKPIPQDTAPTFGSKDKQASLHDQIVLRAERWLDNQGCSVVIREPFRSWNKEQPDAIGWRSDVSILIEVKASRSDFLSDKSKTFRADPDKGMGDWRFYMCPPGIIKIEDLPKGWGLLYVTDKTVKRVHGIPPNAAWSREKPFDGNKANENTMLTSALRRLKLRGYLPEIYAGVLVDENGHQMETRL